MNTYNNILDTFYKLQKQIENTLEQTAPRVTPSENSPEPNSAEARYQNNFEASHDFSSFDDMARHLSVDDEERIILIFTKLTHFYEAGILFELAKDGVHYLPQIYFNKGQVSTLHETKPTTLSHKEISLPAMSIQQVLKFKNNDLLKKIGLEFLDPKNDLTILLFKPTAEYSFCLLSGLPDLWLREHAETLFNKLMKSVTP